LAAGPHSKLGWLTPWDHASANPQSPASVLRTLISSRASSLQHQPTKVNAISSSTMPRRQGGASRWFWYIVDSMLSTFSIVDLLLNIFVVKAYQTQAPLN
jgi:hypothetical protein